jgi:hypothetical protein
MIRLLILVLLIFFGYFVIKLIKALFLPTTQDKEVRGNSKQKSRIKNKNIEDADYEDIT